MQHPRSGGKVFSDLLVMVEVGWFFLVANRVRMDGGQSRERTRGDGGRFH